MRPPWLSWPVACLVCGLLGLASGWIAGRHGAQVPALQVVAKPTPERDRSPAGEARTVIQTRTAPGNPPPPPVAVADLGQHLSTTRTELPGGDPLTLHAATFARVDGRSLELQTVEWATDPAGRRVSLGEAETIRAPLRLPLPPPPRWTAAALLGAGRPGLLLTRSEGPWTLGAAHLHGQTVAVVGVRW